MRARVAISLLIGSAMVATVMAQPDLPRNEDARLAKSRYESGIKKAQEEYDKQVNMLRTWYIKDLEAALKAALKAEQLEEAVRIRDAKKALEDGATTKPAEPTTSKSGREGAIAFRGTHYKIVLAQVRSWEEARDAAKKLGGDLAVLDTKEKRELMAKLNETVQLWVGAHKDNRTGKWMWVNGTPIAADAWAPGRPENNGPAAVVFQKTGHLGDGKEDMVTAGFVCEWKK